MATIPVYSPRTPFTGEIPGGLFPGLTLRIKGIIKGLDQRCMIDLMSNQKGNQDIIFHVSMRPREGVIVRNHFQNKNWGAEERDGIGKIRADETFELLITAEREHYKLTMNGQFLAVFRHRLPLHLVKCIQVSGKVIIDHILVEQNMSAYQQPQVMSSTQFSMPSAPQMMQIQTPMQAHPPPPNYFAQQPPNYYPSQQGSSSYGKPY